MDATPQQMEVQLQSADVARRASAAEALAQLGPDARPVAVSLVAAQADADENVRQWATSALEDMGAPRSEDLPRLVELLASPSDDVCYWAATLLGRLGPTATPALAQLEALAKTHASPNVKRRAQSAIEKIKG